MDITSEREETLTDVVNKLEFDRRGKTTINVDDLAYITLERVWGIQLQPRGHSKAHFVDCKLTNNFYTVERDLFFYWDVHKKIEASGILIEVMPGKNRLELIVYERENPAEKKSIFYEFEIEGRIYQKENVVFCAC